MSDDTPTSYKAETPGTAEGAFEATTHTIGKKIIETLRKSFTGNGKVQRGDFYLNQSRELLQKNFQLLHPDDQIIVQEQFTM
jgi:hypothetical protein